MGRRSLSELMAERGLTVMSLAKKAGVPHSLVSALLRRKTVPKVPTARKIADALGVGVDDIVFPGELQPTEAAGEGQQPRATLSQNPRQEGGMAA